MTKLILAMAIAATLVLGTFAIGSAFAVERGDEISFKGKANKVVVDQASDYPSKAKAKAKIQFTVDQVQDSTYGGFGRLAVVIDFKGDQDFDPIVIPPTDSNIFRYQYDDVGNILTIRETQVQSDSGESFTLSGEGSYDLDERDKSRANITLTLSSDTSDDVLTIPVKGIALGDLTSDGIPE